MPPRLVRFLRFNLVGALGIVVQLTTAAVLVEVLGLHYVLATMLAIELSVLHNFAWHERWTWAPDRTEGGEESGILLRCLLFHAGNGCVSLVGSLALLPLFVGGLHLHYLAANLLAIAATGLLNFVIGDRVVFTAGRGQHAGDQRIPSSAARRSARLRSRTPSFEKIVDARFFTVPSDRSRRSAISRLL
jgi:putative flippase GtrA